MDEETAPLDLRRAVSFSLNWCFRNLAIELVRPIGAHRMVLRYEDFVAGPERALEGICDFVGEPLGESPLAEGRTVDLGENHMVSGNRSRYLRGAVRIHPDDEWRKRMSARTVFLGTVSGLPLLRRYGYRTVLRPSE